MELDVGERAVQGYVRDLEEDNRLVLKSEGKPNHWRLADTEPTEPVYNPKVGKAKRWGNKARKVGNWSFLIGVGILAAAGLVTSNHVFAQVVGITLPLVDGEDAVTAGLVGVLGMLLFLIAFIAYVWAFILPRVIEWRIDDPIPRDQEP